MVFYLLMWSESAPPTLCTEHMKERCEIQLTEKKGSLWITFISAVILQWQKLPCIFLMYNLKHVFLVCRVQAIKKCCLTNGCVDIFSGIAGDSASFVQAL